jgi:hypothetical protein
VFPTARQGVAEPDSARSGQPPPANARAGIWELERSPDSHCECLIEIAVKGDCERFPSPADLLEQATPEALRGFNAIRITLRDAHSSIEISIGRQPGGGLKEQETPGVLLEVSSDGRGIEEVCAIRDAVAGAINRGRFRRGKEPKVGHQDPADKPHVVLESRVRRRNRWVAASYLTFALAISVAIVAGASALGLSALADPTTLGAAIGVPIAILLISLPAAGISKRGTLLQALIVAELPAGLVLLLGQLFGVDVPDALQGVAAGFVLAVFVGFWAAWLAETLAKRLTPDDSEPARRIWTLLGEAVFPAVEIAERTAGRRLLRGAVRTGSVIVFPVVGALASAATSVVIPGI